MRKNTLTSSVLKAFLQKMIQEEKAPATLEKYKRDTRAFFEFLQDDKKVTKEAVMLYKRYLLEKGYAVSSINSMLVAVNSLLCFTDRRDCCVRLFKQQRRTFGEKEKELTRQEYVRLVETALKRHDRRLALILQTICCTGIRISELEYVTVQSLQRHEAQVYCKNKLRKILLPKALCMRLTAYCREKGIRSGSVFVSRKGKPLNRSNIWAAMKKLCESAGIAAKKVFPHNLRHLFARTFYKQHKDIVRLADILGHSSVDTTRIYTLTSGAEQLSQLARMRLLI